jgi:hypothetical protein
MNTNPIVSGGCSHLNEVELAERWAVSVALIRKMRLAGTGVRFRKYGSAVRYALSDIEAYEQSCVRWSTSDPGSARG